MKKMNNPIKKTGSNNNSGNPLSRRKFIEKVMMVTAGAALIPTVKAPRWQIGCYTRPWAAYEYKVAFDGIARAGFKYAGLMTSKTGNIMTLQTTTEQAAAIGAEAKSRGLEIASMWSGNFDVKKSIDEGIKGLKRIIDNSASCGCPNLLLGGIAAPELVDSYYKVVAECCAYASEKGVGISVKPHGPLNSTGRECRPLINKVGHKNFGLWYDPGNIYYYSDGKISPVDDAAEVDGMVVGMSVKDFRMPKSVDVTPGTGMVDFPKVMARLKKGGFTRGPLIVECLATGDQAFVDAEARKAFLFLEKLVK
jgi:sugar phosphate isomerase/epimerase